MVRYNISFAGAGRVAGNLCREMHNAGFNILRIVSEDRSNGEPLARMYGAVWSSRLSFEKGNDVIIVAVPDHRLTEVLNQLESPPGCIVAHTAGSYGLEVFPDRVAFPAVFYPLQTFSKERNVSFIDLPVLLESKDKVKGEVLMEIAKAIGAKASFTALEQRRLIHISAVFVCNFTNFMLTEGKTISEKAGLSFDLLVPLIRETIEKAIENTPEASQTGPAVRNDLNTIEKHSDLLSFSPKLQELYKVVTRSIMEYYKTTR
jgi:predicted short-subunit dehydrogenase-like oxidoreductase (DUF2520 family)